MTQPFLKTQAFQGLKGSSSHCLGEPFLKKQRGGPKQATQEPSLCLYDRQTLDSCPWPTHAEGQYAKRFLTPLIQKGTSHFIENVRTDLRVLIWGDIVLPLTLNEADYDNSFVCSPYSYYISYAKECLTPLSQSWTNRALNGLLDGIGALLRRYQLNKVIMVNNWLCSTNLYPHLTAEQLTHIAQFLQQRFPEHALLFRSIDPLTSGVCYQTLQSLGFDYIASRQIYVFDARISPFFESRLFKSDSKLLQNSGYEVLDQSQLSLGDVPRLLELYQSLYIDKYSSINPQLNADFLTLLLSQELMHFKVLKKDGKIDGVVGYVEHNGMMFCPFFGYDRLIPKDVGLYRLLSTLLVLEARERKLFFHQGAGASMFKSIRKAVPCFEYTAVYRMHLKFKRQVPWLILKGLCNTLGVFCMKRY